MKRLGYAPVGVGAETVQATLPADAGLYASEQSPQAQIGYVYGASIPRAAWKGSGEQPPCLTGEKDVATEQVLRYVSFLEKPASAGSEKGKPGERIDQETVIERVANPALRISAYCGKCAVASQCTVRDAVDLLKSRRAAGKRHNQKGPQNPAL